MSFFDSAVVLSVVVSVGAWFVLLVALFRRLGILPALQAKEDRNTQAVLTAISALRNDLATTRLLSGGPLVIEVPELLRQRIETIATEERVHRFAVAKVALQKGLEAWTLHNRRPETQPENTLTPSEASSPASSPAPTSAIQEPTSLVATMPRERTGAKPFDGWDEEEKTTLFDDHERPTREMPLPPILEAKAAANGVRLTPTRLSPGAATSRVEKEGTGR